MPSALYVSSFQSQQPYKVLFYLYVADEVYGIYFHSAAQLVSRKWSIPAFRLQWAILPLFKQTNGIY